MNNNISKKAGLPPGALIHIGKRKADKVKISVIDYDELLFQNISCENIQECSKFKDSKTVSWINIDGLHDINVIEEVGKIFGLHPLLLEDVLNTKNRPKIEEFDNYLFVSLKMIGFAKGRNTIVSEQISFVIGDNWIISFQEQEGDVFDSLRDRLSSSKGIIKQKKVDYLLYRLIDTIVDNYFYVTEHISRKIEKTEEQVLHLPDTKALHEIQRIKKQVLSFKRMVGPIREIIFSLQKDTSMINENTILYLKDVYEHTIQINEIIEMQRDSIANLMDLYLSGLSNKTNQVMQVLTIISTIFIPLTFIAGIYGMNFEYMPELHWKYGYTGVWTLMLLVLVGMFIFFKRKKWL